MNRVISACNSGSGISSGARMRAHQIASGSSARSAAGVSSPRGRLSASEATLTGLVAQRRRLVDQKPGNPLVWQHFPARAMDLAQPEYRIGIAARRSLAIKRVGSGEIAFDVLAALVHYGQRHQRRYIAAFGRRFEDRSVLVLFRCCVTAYQREGERKRLQGQVQLFANHHSTCRRAAVRFQSA